VGKWRLRREDGGVIKAENMGCDEMEAEKRGSWGNWRLRRAEGGEIKAE